MRRSFFAATLLASAWFLASTRAHATAEYPSVIVSHLAITCTDGGTATPDCVICHQNDNGGLGTATRPLGAWMKANGLGAFQDSKLNTLLDQAKADNLDSNCDGVPDIQQLESCDWPALETMGTVSCGDAGATLTVLYGCSAAPTAPQTTSSDPLPASAAIGTTLVLACAIALKRRARTSKFT